MLEMCECFEFHDTHRRCYERNEHVCEACECDCHDVDWLYVWPE